MYAAEAVSVLEGDRCGGQAEQANQTVVPSDCQQKYLEVLLALD